MKTIDELLIEIKEDKTDNLSTTSFQFKRDLLDFFADFKDKSVVEFGTHKGQTTRILSYLFKSIHTVNNTDNEYAKQLNIDRTNISYHNVDLYSTQSVLVDEPISMFLIDAGHSYDHVIADLNRAFSMQCSEECYIVFDDYGLIPDVRAAVDYAINQKCLTVIAEIGHEAGHNFGIGNKEGDDRILQKSEGLITKIIFQ